MGLFSSADVAIAAQTTHREGVLRTLTYNVAGLPQFLSHTSPDANMPQISSKLDTYSLVLVQEDFAYHLELSQQAHHEYRSQTRHRSLFQARDGLNRFSDSPFTNFTRVTWERCAGYFSGRSDCFADKGFSWAKHQLAPGVTIDIYNLHADAGREDNDRAARKAEFEQLATFIADHSAGEAVIIGGDTNLKTDSWEDQKTLEEFLRATGTQMVARVLNQLPERIDLFLYRGAQALLLEPQRRAIAQEFVDGDGNPLSDHQALRVDFAWRTQLSARLPISGFRDERK